MMLSNTSDQQIVSSLNGLLASVHQLAMKARFYHWNVTGIWFAPLHALFESHYNALAETEDELAERLRALRQSAPFSTAQLLSASTVNDDAQIPNASQMLHNLLDGYLQLNALAVALENEAEQLNDSVTADMMVGLMQGWQKAMWMLRAHLDEK